MTKPSYSVQVAFGVAPLVDPTSGQWVDVTPYVRRLSTRRGRNHELGRTTAGVAEIVLDNRDRRFDPTFAGSQLIPVQNETDFEVALAGSDVGAINGGTFARTTTAGQFMQGIAGLSVTAHATNGNSGVTLGQTTGLVGLPEVVPGVAYVFSIGVKGNAANSFILRITWTDAAGTAISNADSSPMTAPTGAFAIFSTSAVAPPGAAYARLRMLFPTGGAGKTNYYDEALFEVGTSPSAWPGTAPYYPNIRPMQHVRIRAVLSAATYEVFRGYVEDWGQGWGGPAPMGQGDALVTMTASDGFKALSLRNLRSYSEEVLADSPGIYWPLTGADVATCAVNLGSLDGLVPVFGNDDTNLGYGVPGRASAPFSNTAGQTSVDVPLNGSYYAFSHRQGLPEGIGGGAVTIEFWVLVDAYQAADSELIRPGQQPAVSMDGTGSAVAGTIVAIYLNSNGGSTQLSCPSGGVLTTGTWHHVAVIFTPSVVTFYMDGAFQASQDVRAIPPTVNGMVGCGRSLDGALAHIAIYGTALTPERIAAHASAPTDTIGPSGSGAALGYILNASGWPAGLRALDTGASTVTMTPSGSALDVMQAVAEDTEHGILTMTPDGKVTFIGRDTLEGRLSSSATFGDGGGAETAYTDLQLAYDDQDLWTEVGVSGAGQSEVIVSDASSVTAYGTRTLSISTLSPSANEIADQANGLLNRYKAPAVRPVSMALHKEASMQAQLTRAIGDRVTLKRRPPGGGTITTDALVEGIDNNLDADGWPLTTFALAPPEPAQFWVLGDSTNGKLDVTTRLGW